MRAESPCYLWWPKDYAADGNVRRMTWEEQGIYRHLLDLCWLEGGFDAEPPSFRRIVGCSMKKADRLLALFEPCFEWDEDIRPGWWWHKRIEYERRVQNEKREKASARGRAGAQARHKQGSSNAQA